MVPKRETLLDFFATLAENPGEFLVYDNGYRSYSFTYAEVAAGARAFAAALNQQGLQKGDKVIFWSENRPEWIIALWGCLLQGVIAVPVDFRASDALLTRLHRIVESKLVLIGDDLHVPALDPPAPVWRLAELKPEQGPLPQPDIRREGIAEIMFTSGATADPKGVIITHSNILANIVPVEGEVLKYRRYGRPFYPIRFLNLLPLSHMFGQAMATFIPPMVPGVVVFMHGFSPEEIVRQIHMRRISVLVSVPKILEVLRDYVIRMAPEAAISPPGKEHFLRRWYRYRRVHRLLGWKFWACIVGAAPLDPELEEFWSRLGYVVIQGYGLTETAPIVTLNHPFHAKKGTVGKPIAGVEVKVASDGEILVRGGNVTQGYYNPGAESSTAFEDGWFHTGDIGEVDSSGALSIRGRKKEMIVTPEGLNVFPEDVERVLNSLEGVRDSAVIGTDRIHAVLLLEPGVQAKDIVHQANAKLEDHQKIRGFSLWTEGDLPRTEGTQKLKRREIAEWAATGNRAPSPAGPATDLASLLRRYSSGREVTSQTTIDDLGLSSLERVELLMEMERHFQTTVDEASFSKNQTVAELSASMTGQKRSAPEQPIDFPRWNRSLLARLLRRVALPFWLLPLARVFAWVRAEGRANLAGIEGPVIFASNHQSHLDVPVILAGLPSRLRYRVAPAMAKEFFDAHFFPGRHNGLEWFTNSLNYYLSSLFFNAFPLPQRESGTRQTMRYMGEMVSEGWCILIFPEGKRTLEGEIYPFQPGVGMLASRLAVPVIPVRIEGVDRVLHQHWMMARPGRVTVKFGAPLKLEGDDVASLAKRVEAAVRAL